MIVMIYFIYIYSKHLLQGQTPGARCLKTHLKKEDSSSNKSGNVPPTHLIKQCLSCDEYTVRGRYMISNMIGHY